MAKLFKLALESSDLEGAVAPESTQPALDEAELEQNVEETTQEQAEIEQGGEEIDQALEEAEGLVEQIEANDEKLENPDAVVTAADVEVSEEALKRACYSLGIPFQANLSFASESVANDIRANARKYLATSNETAKDVVKAIIDALKVMVKSVGKLIKEVYTKIAFKVANYTKQIKEANEALKGLTQENLDAEKVKIALKESNSAELQYALLKNKVITSPSTKSTLVNLEKRVDQAMKMGMETNESMREYYENVIKATADTVVGDRANPSEYGFKEFREFATSPLNTILCITGNKALVVKEEDLSIVKVRLERDDTAIDRALGKFDAYKLFHQALSSGTVNKYLADIKDFNSNLAEIKKIQNKMEKDSINSEKIFDPKSARLKVMAIKSIGITATTFEMDRYINIIKAYVKLLRIYVAAKK